MKYLFAAIFILSTITGCHGRESPLTPALELRKALLAAQTCSFQTVITADYGEDLYTFQMDCCADSTGKLTFTVLEPTSIAGITGSISKDKAALTFDGHVLAFPVLAEGDLSPVSAPWIFLNSLRGGYLSGCSEQADGFCLYLDDTFGADPLQLEIWTDTNCVPIGAEIIWHDRRILSIEIRNFQFQ